MDLAPTTDLTVPLTATERDQVSRAAATAGISVDEFVRNAVLDATRDPFLLALEQAVNTAAARATAAPAADSSTTPASELTHRYCCDENLALCGLDITELGEARPGEQDCVVCEDLDEADIACPQCP
jgi:uncharacterized protein (DUF1778 family)